jgi:lipoprotein-releasing system permease protein
LLKARLKQTVVAAVGVTSLCDVYRFGELYEIGYWMDGLMLNRTPHVRLYNEVKPAENQPLYQLTIKKQTLLIR